MAVCSLALTGLSGTFGTAAFAAEGDDVAPTSGVEFDALAKSLLTEDAVQAVATDDNGNVVIYTTDPSADKARTAKENTSNVVVKDLDAPLSAYSTNDVVGGAGYAVPGDTEGSVGLCSIGFSAWSPTGAPAVISAGHCTDDGNAVDSRLTLPTKDEAGGAAPDSPIQTTQELGKLKFAQFGGPNNSAGASGAADSVDISVIDITNNALTTLPQVTDWTTSGTEDLSGSTKPVRSVGAAQLGQPVAKSGRTTGYTTGTIDSVGGWAKVEDRWVSGFMSIIPSIPGDSGGSIIQGDRAVGVVSGGTVTDGVSYMWGANLQSGLAVAGGYTVALFLDAPAVNAQSTYFTDAPVTGTGPAGAKLTVTPSVGAPFEVTVDANGAWSFPAPGTEGNYSYSMVAKKGFDTSAETTFNIAVVLAPPVFTSPVNGQLIETSLKAITGTGKAGATVTLTGSVTGTAVVDGNGNWSVPTDLTYGGYTVNATQETPNPTSDALAVGALAASTPVTVAFQVGPVAPVITSPANGLVYVEGSGPTQVGGTGIDGATVNVTVNGVSAGTATVANGEWTLPLVGQLAAGSVTITAAQTINGVSGTVATSTITISAAGVATPAGGPATPVSLANTGAPVMPLLGGGLALLIAAGGMMLIARRSGATRTN